MSNIMEDITKLASGDMTPEEFIKKHGQLPK